MKHSIAGIFGVLAFAAAGAAQSNISINHMSAWQENCGWSNWRNGGEPQAASGVIVHQDHLSGMVWLENAGWVNVGSSLSNGAGYYPNQTGADFGVNILPGGDLQGYAWGENVGWVNFGSTEGGAEQARFDYSSWRFRGYAWGENIGWINLDLANIYVGQRCWTDCNDDNRLNVSDFICFMAKFAAGDSAANCDASTLPPVLNVNDFICYMSAFTTGCP